MSYRSELRYWLRTRLTPLGRYELRLAREYKASTERAIAYLREHRDELAAKGAEAHDRRRAEGREVTPVESRWGENRMVKFTPARVDDLRPEAAGHVGRTFEVYFSGTMDEGPYAGQTIWEPVDGTIWFGWIPDCDLTDAR